MKLYPDISHYHAVTDWSRVKENCPFLITKATQGTGYIDPTLDTIIKNCESRKIPYWLYTFLNKGGELAQARFLVSTCKGKVGKYFVGYILDIEDKNPASGVKEALRYLEKLGGKVMLYTMYAQYSTYKAVIAGRGKNTAWWEARYGLNTGKYSKAYPAHAGVDLHQYTSKGSLPGVSGVNDLNRLTGTKPESWFTSPIGSENKKSAAKKTVEQVAQEVLDGKWGNGEERKKKLAAAGYDYEAVQDAVNRLAKPAKKSLTEIAKEVIAGKWGDGAERKKRLEAAGYDYQAVQKKVNDLV